MLRAAKHEGKLKLKKWILVTPGDFMESATRKDGGDVSWFEGLRARHKLRFELEHWGHTQLLGLFLEAPPLCLFYYPELQSNGVPRRKTIQETRHSYDENIRMTHNRIEFVGMSVYKEEATRGVPMEHIYIPLSVVPEGASSSDEQAPRVNPMNLLAAGQQHVILGDPGSGKSTLLRVLTRVGTSEGLQKRCEGKPDKRLPVLVTLRRYAEQLKQRDNLSLLDYIIESVQGDFSLKSADIEFFEYWLETGQALLLFDGLDELPSPQFKQLVRDRIRTLVTSYPGNTVFVTSRIVGYGRPFRFDEKEFRHHKLAHLLLAEVEQFIQDWYRVRIEDERNRKLNVEDLVRIMRDPSFSAIRELAENPLLLTIIALVHRIDAVLPDQRVILYQKCTETLLNTWHKWKQREGTERVTGKEERRNRRRMEVIAHWMHCRGGEGKKTEAVIAPYDKLKQFLTNHIAQNEKPADPDNDPEDLAEDFLDFVKKRTGLLIEVGDQLYSFVHLTFQEYLCAGHFITEGEIGGAEAIWGNIDDGCDDPRWHEVIRLLVAGLKSDEAQRFLVERLLRTNGREQPVQRAFLAGGLLLDGIDAAVERSREIVGLLFETAWKTEDRDSLRSAASLLRAWRERTEGSSDLLWSLYEATAKRSNLEKRIEIALPLVALLNGEPLSRVKSESPSVFGKSGGCEGVLLRLFLDESLEEEELAPAQGDLERLWAYADALALQSPGGNVFAVVINALACISDAADLCRRRFEAHLSMLGAGVAAGPHGHFAANAFWIIRLDGGGFGALGPLEGAVRRALDHSGRHRVETLERALLALERPRGPGEERVEQRVRHQIAVMARDRAVARARDRAADMGLALERAETANSALVRLREGALEGGLEAAYRQDLLLRNRGVSRWDALVADADFCGALVDAFCDMFDLHPRVQWWEALRVGFLPKVPERLARFYGKNALDRLVRSAARHALGEAEVYDAAALLLVDIWAWSFSDLKGVEQSPYYQLAELTRGVEAAPLRIAHCLRDLAHGDEHRTGDLKQMVRSQDPEYRAIFKRCYWR